MTKSKIIDAMLETAHDLGMDAVTIRELEQLNLPEVKMLTSGNIKKMRTRSKVSQAVMAKILNVTPSTYQKWERGEVHPKGANLKLLRLAYDHGLDYIVS
ncbi:MAG: transcriptional regulator [Legionellales bacterium]|nr:transcriptional regulator [Legionellales bacterium]|tara:strand:- start:162 stop:461 length:300 start_codon:yes stop_codon:yes gene_type:complete